MFLHDRTSNMTDFQILSREPQIGSCADRMSNACVSLEGFEVLSTEFDILLTERQILLIKLRVLL